MGETQMNSRKLSFWSFHIWDWLYFWALKTAFSAIFYDKNIAWASKYRARYFRLSVAVGYQFFKNTNFPRYLLKVDNRLSRTLLVLFNVFEFFNSGCYVFEFDIDLILILSEHHEIFLIFFLQLHPDQLSHQFIIIL